MAPQTEAARLPAQSTAGATGSWNLQAKVSADELRFTIPAHVKPIRDKVLDFVERHVYPLEATLRGLAERGDAALGGGGIKPGAASPTHPQPEIARLQRLAKEQGLWALGHPVEIGGQGMPFRDYVFVNEVQGRSEVAPLVLGSHSLQDSLMLLNHASREIKDEYLADVVAARAYPSFGMTEPDVASSTPTDLQATAALEDGGKTWRIAGRKWFTTNARNAAFTRSAGRSRVTRTAGPAALTRAEPASWFAPSRRPRRRT